MCSKSCTYRMKILRRNPVLFGSERFRKEDADVEQTCKKHIEEKCEEVIKRLRLA